MEFLVVFDKKAAKDLAKLPKDIKTRIFSKIVESKIDPLRFFERLKGRKDYKLRIGDYRVIYRYRLTFKGREILDEILNDDPQLKRLLKLTHVYELQECKYAKKKGMGTKVSVPG